MCLKELESGGRRRRNGKKFAKWPCAGYEKKLYWEPSGMVLEEYCDGADG